MCGIGVSCFISGAIDLNLFRFFITQMYFLWLLGIQGSPPRIGCHTAVGVESLSRDPPSPPPHLPPQTTTTTLRSKWGISRSIHDFKIPYIVNTIQSLNVYFSIQNTVIVVDPYSLQEKIIPHTSSFSSRKKGDPHPVAKYHTQYIVQCPVGSGAIKMLADILTCLSSNKLLVDVF